MSLPNIPKAISMEIIAAKTIQQDQRSFVQKFKYIVTHITVEPLVFFYILPGVMGLLTTQNLNLEKACRVSLQFNQSVCDAMLNRDHTGYEDYHEAEVQKLVAKMLTIKTAVIGFFPTLLMLFFGSWSDRHQRRKPVILIPIVCDIISGLGLMTCSYYFMELSIYYVLLTDCFPYALGGGWSCVFLGAFSYVSGISSEEERTIRIGTLSMFQNVAMTTGNALGGYFIGPLGLVGSYFVVTIIMCGCLVYGMIIIKDPKKEERRVVKVKNKNFVQDFLDLQHVKSTFQICFKEGPSNRKWRVIIIMMATVLIIGPLQGEFAVLYLYTRYKFGWNEVNYSIFSSCQFIVQIIGSTFALSFFSKKLKFDDATLGIIALVSKISACLVYAFVPTGQYFLIGCLVEIFHGTCHIALRSLMGKIVPPHELGQTNSMFGVCEAIMPLVFGPFYTTLYHYTIKVFPGAFYLVSATLYMITLPLFICLYKFNKEERKQTKEKELQIEQEENLLMKAITNGRKKSLDILKA
ncbi:tetracycline resistance protein, class H-like isoform X1 [Coccinella septempunctata]|uniref:tetracycline resistance protein, class H-like isoform X1 n=1 Tax=Coccinella septempunctata TaxID=41139 RepID=UPI001D0605F5|nr:tetracycline resistance protein, class H-like isoform X1 [Coccinella septempunctata]